MSKKPPIRNACKLKPRRSNSMLDALKVYVKFLNGQRELHLKRIEMLEALERTRSAAEQARTQDERIREENRKGRQAHEA